ncbi:MAG: hypothetical protein K5643_06430 [Saccharofermentans sp.]|nr:hypothetical protein [Saccharofermentans sp.]
MGKKEVDILELEDEQEGLLWEKCGVKTLEANIVEVTKKVNEASQKLKDHSNYEAAKDALEKLYTKEISQSAWIFQFRSQNAKVLKMEDDDDEETIVKPEDFEDWPIDKKRDYKILVETMKGLKFLELYCLGICRFLIDFPLHKGYTLFRLVNVLEKEGYTSSYFQEVNNDMLSVYKQLSFDYNELESKAGKSQEYLDKNMLKKWDKSKLDTFKKKRQEDFRKIVESQCSFYKYMEFRNGVFKVKNHTLNKLHSFDGYTAKLIDLAGSSFGDALSKADDRYDKLSEMIKEFTGEKCENDSVCRLGDALETLVETAKEFLDTCGDLGTQYNEASTGNTPFCFLGVLPALSSSANYDFPASSATDDPHDSGTHYADLFKSAASAITEQCKDFVTMQGDLA